jgi:putative thioredoxin
VPGAGSLPASVPGVVDLAALAEARQVQQQAAQARSGLQARAGAAGAVVIDVSESSFDVDVMQRSMTTPVLIDFWATWCQPCTQLSPVLEKLAVEDGGAWVLAKVDVDANPQLSAAAQVQSIPTVMVVWQGQVIPGFQGALPEPQVRLFVDEVLALAGRTDSDVVPDVVDPALEEAENALLADDLDTAAAAYERLLDERPGDTEASAGLSRVRLMQRTRDVDAAAVREVAAADPSDVKAQQSAADLDLLDGDVEGAIARLLAAVRATTGNERDQARDALLELFAIVGDDDPVVLSGRRQLSNALF